MKVLRSLLIVIVVLAAMFAAVLFTVQNPEPVALDVLIYRFQPHSIALWVLLAFVVGGFAGMLASTLVIFRHRAGRGSANRKLNKANAEINRLRTAGLTRSE
ncbi:MAG: lipopolysaccharide assembly protein LapA domain-containing protein [Parahaliea sp.]